MKTTEPQTTARRPSDPLMKAADVALRRAAVKAQARARQAGSPPEKHPKPERAA